MVTCGYHGNKWIGIFKNRAEQKKCKKLSKEKDNLNKELSAQNDRVREMEKKEKELLDKVKNLQEEMERLQKQLKDKERLIKKLINEKETLEKEIDQLQKDSSKLNHKNNELETLLTTQV
jgi:chromosome segregation ATPase